jgi:hypothetical protein
VTAYQTDPPADKIRASQDPYPTRIWGQLTTSKKGTGRTGRHPEIAEIRCRTGSAEWDVANREVATELQLAERAPVLRKQGVDQQ